MRLDAHLELYRQLKQLADELGNDVSFKRTDLALFDLNAAERTITCRLVEVKCYAAVGHFAAYAALKERVAAQIAQSEDVLAQHFDPHRRPTDRADRLVKTRQLVTLLEFYPDRGVRYGLMEERAADEARFLLRSLEQGYRLIFTRSGLVFDFEKDGSEVEHEHGIEFHRVGFDLIRELVEAAAPTPREETAIAVSLAPEIARPEKSELQRARRRRRAASIPSLETASFLGASRERTAPWEELVSAHDAVGRESVMADGDSGDSPSGGAEPPAVANALTIDSHREPRSAPDTGADLPGHDAPPRIPDAVGVDADVVRSESEPATSALGAREQPMTESVPMTAESEGPSGPDYDVMLGVTASSPQYGILGEVAGRRVALDLNHTHTISPKTSDRARGRPVCRLGSTR